MNVYDEAHNLARAIRESEEYKQYRDAKERVEANPQLNNMIKDFANQQMQMQAKQMMGEELGPDRLEQIQKLYGIIQQDPLASEYLQCQMRFSIMINDVLDIVGEVAGDVMGMGEEQ